MGWTATTTKKTIELPILKKILFVFGTRPEAIKLAPVINLFKAKSTFDVTVCVTGQHREMLKQVLDVFDIEPDIDLGLMRPNQSLASLTALAIEQLNGVVAAQKPDLVLVQGDTTTVFCATLAAFYNRIPVGHIEAGLRTGNLLSPWPEEANRVLTTRLASLHFAPTPAARRNLLTENVPEDRITVTGNTVIDALLMAKGFVKAQNVSIASLPAHLQPNARSDRDMVLITGHRRENFGQGFEQICRAIRTLAERFAEVEFVYPVHLNPNVQEPVNRILSDHLANVHLIEPQPYLEFVGLMSRSKLILTDSGGVQEEAPSLGKPVLVMRDTTERPEAMQAGTSRLVGTDHARIVDAVTELLTTPTVFNQMSQAGNPYGDGHASEHILAACLSFLNR